MCDFSNCTFVLLYSGSLFSFSTFKYLNNNVYFKNSLSIDSVKNLHKKFYTMFT